MHADLKDLEKSGLSVVWPVGQGASRRRRLRSRTPAGLAESSRNRDSPSVNPVREKSLGRPGNGVAALAEDGQDVEDAAALTDLQALSKDSIPVVWPL